MMGNEYAALLGRSLAVSVTMKFLIHCAATAIDIAFPRMELGKISDSITHTTGPHENENPRM